MLEVIHKNPYEIFEDFEDKGFHNVDVTLTKDYLSDADKCFRNLVETYNWEELGKIKTWWNKSKVYPWTKKNKNDRYNYGATELGFWPKYRGENEGDDDTKIWMHDSPALDEIIDSLNDNTMRIDIQNFRQKYSLPIRKIMLKNTIEPIIRDMQIMFPNIYEEFFPEGKEEFAYLRFLYYLEDKKDKRKALASPHFDASALTVAAYESHGGLRIAPERDPHNLIEHRYEEGKGRMFMGSRFSAVVPQKTYHHLTNLRGHHEVINSEDLNQGEIRTAIVLFLSPYKLSKSFRESGRLREVDLFESDKQKEKYIPRVA